MAACTLWSRGPGLASATARSSRRRACCFVGRSPIKSRYTNLSRWIFRGHRRRHRSRGNDILRLQIIRLRLFTPDTGSNGFPFVHYEVVSICIRSASGGISFRLCGHRAGSARVCAGYRDVDIGQIISRVHDVGSDTHGARHGGIVDGRKLEPDAPAPARRCPCLTVPSA